MKRIVTRRCRQPFCCHFSRIFLFWSFLWSKINQVLVSHSYLLFPHLHHLLLPSTYVPQTKLSVCPLIQSREKAYWIHATQLCHLLLFGVFPFASTTHTGQQKHLHPEQLGSGFSEIFHANGSSSFTFLAFLVYEPSSPAAFAGTFLPDFAFYNTNNMVHFVPLRVSSCFQCKCYCNVFTFPSSNQAINASFSKTIMFLPGCQPAAHFSPGNYCMCFRRYRGIVSLYHIHNIPVWVYTHHLCRYCAVHRSQRPFALLLPECAFSRARGLPRHSYQVFSRGTHRSDTSVERSGEH